MIKIVYQLSDTTPLSGNTVIVPQSNNLTQPLEIPKGQNDPDDAIELELRAGDAILFEGLDFLSDPLHRK